MPITTRQARESRWILLLAALLAFAFLGARGLWDPDEGRYTNVALNMLDRGDWVDPMRNDDTGHWTKPPLTYWLVASSVGAFGPQPWAARVPSALSYLLCVLLVARIARRLAPGSEATAALTYATMLLPFGASQIVTTDHVLAACETLAAWAYVEARWGRSHPARWVTLMWAAFGLAFLAKGPPALLPLAAIVAFERLVPGERRALQWRGLGLFLALSLPWYLLVGYRHPGLLGYFVGDEVIKRVASDEFHRFGQWYGWLLVYVPTLLVGTLPWTPALWRWWRALGARLRAWRDAPARGEDAIVLFLASWVLVPLAVLCVARSRLPLYVLPLFASLALMVAMQRLREARALPAWPLAGSWVVALLALKLAAAAWPTHKDASQWARAIQARAQAPVSEVAFVEDMARYGLRLHLGAGIEKISLDPLAPSRQPSFNPNYDEDLATELLESRGEPAQVWVCKLGAWPSVRDRIAESGYRATPLGAPYRDRMIFRTEPPPAAATVPAG